MLAGWQYSWRVYLRDLADLETLTPTTLQDRKLLATVKRDLAVAQGIATERTLLLAGHPTQIVAGLHAVRVSLPDLAAKLARVVLALTAETPAETPETGTDHAR